MQVKSAILNPNIITLILLNKIGDKVYVYKVYIPKKSHRLKSKRKKILLNKNVVSFFLLNVVYENISSSLMMSVSTISSVFFLSPSMLSVSF